MCSLLSIKYLQRAVVDALWVKLEPFLDDDVTLFQLSPLFFTPSALTSIPHLLFLLSAFLPPAAAFVTRPFSTYLPFFLFFSVLALCLKPAHLSQHLQHHSLYPCLLLCSPSPSIYLSITPTSLSLPLISLPMLWFVSLVSVRTVITAVSSLGENKVVLCSRHHKRHKRNKRKEPQPKKRKKKKKRRKGGKIKQEESKPEEGRVLGTHLFMSTMMHCHL